MKKVLCLIAFFLWVGTAMGATGLKVQCEEGLYVDVSCSGTVKVVLYFAPAEVPIALQ